MSNPIQAHSYRAAPAMSDGTTLPFPVPAVCTRKISGHKTGDRQNSGRRSLCQTIAESWEATMAQDQLLQVALKKVSVRRRAPETGS